MYSKPQYRNQTFLRKKATKKNSLSHFKFNWKYALKLRFNPEIMAQFQYHFLKTVQPNESYHESNEEKSIKYDEREIFEYRNRFRKKMIRSPSLQTYRDLISEKPLDSQIRRWNSEEKIQKENKEKELSEKNQNSFSIGKLRKTKNQFSSSSEILEQNLYSDEKPQLTSEDHHTFNEILLEVRSENNISRGSKEFSCFPSSGFQGEEQFNLDSKKKIEKNEENSFKLIFKPFLMNSKQRIEDERKLGLLQFKQTSLEKHINNKTQNSKNHYSNESQHSLDKKIRYYENKNSRNSISPRAKKVLTNEKNLNILKIPDPAITKSNERIFDFDFEGAKELKNYFVEGNIKNILKKNFKIEDSTPYLSPLIRPRTKKLPAAWKKTIKK